VRVYPSGSVGIQGGLKTNRDTGDLHQNHASVVSVATAATMPWRCDTDPQSRADPCRRLRTGSAGSIPRGNINVSSLCNARITVVKWKGYLRQQPIMQVSYQMT
jgi:hypothetical protein